MQPLLMPVWSAARVPKPATEKSPAATWQVEQEASGVGICPTGLVWALKKLVPEWH